jgi:melanocortin 2 receptor
MNDTYGCISLFSDNLFAEDKKEIFETANAVNIFFNVILSLCATLGNGLVIIAILKSRNLQTPSYLLIISLGFSDILVGLLYHPMQIVLSTMYFQRNVEFMCKRWGAFNFTTAFLGGVSSIMATCISIDRYLAIRLRHRYRVAVTQKRVRIVIILAWILSFIQAFFSMDMAYIIYYQLAIISIQGLLLVTTCTFYIKAFRALHLHDLQVHAQQQSQLNNFDVVKYRNALYTMLIVLGCLLVCYVPIVCSVAGMILGVTFNIPFKPEYMLLYFGALTIMGVIPV